MGSLTYNSNNQKSGTGYSYDGNGNPTTYAGTSLGFDLESRLTAIGSSWSAGYRPDGLRGSKTASSTTTYFLYDGATPVAELNSSGTITALNVFGADGLIGRVVPGGTDIQYLFDHQGNVAQRLDGSGSVVSKSTYDAYGAESSTSTPTDPFGYNAQSGYYLDRETGLYLCTYRYYDPAKGRWLNRDHIGYAGGMNLYGYCGAGPVGGWDPSGLQATWWDGVSNVAAAVGDALTFASPSGIITGVLAKGQPISGTQSFRIWLGYDDHVDEESAEYKWGTVAGTVLGLGLEAGAASCAQWMKVGRWMGEEEHGLMVATKRVQAGRDYGQMGQEATNAIHPPSPTGFKNAPAGSKFIEFLVPRRNVVPGGRPDWVKIIGGGSREGGRLGLPKGMPGFRGLHPW